MIRRGDVLTAIGDTRVASAILLQSDIGPHAAHGTGEALLAR